MRRSASTLVYNRVLNEGKPLSRDEEEHLFDTYHHHTDAAVRDDAHKKIVLGNQRLVCHIAKPYAKRTKNVDLDDLLGEGNYGLLEAIPKFDPLYGCRFAAYAKAWIRNRILSYIRSSRQDWQGGGNSRMSRKFFLKYSKLRKRAEQEVANTHKESACYHEEDVERRVANYLGMSIEKIRIHEALYFSPRIGFDTVCGRVEDDRRAGAPGEAYDPSDLLDRQKLVVILKGSYTVLSPMEKDILAQRFGIGKDPCRFETTPRREIGKKYDLCGERIRQIEKKAIEKLRASLESVLNGKDI